MKPHVDDRRERLLGTIVAGLSQTETSRLCAGTNTITCFRLRRCHALREACKVPRRITAEVFEAMMHGRPGSGAGGGVGRRGAGRRSKSLGFVLVTPLLSMFPRFR